MQRLSYFDRMKGVAILFVVVGHVFLFSFGTRTSVFTMLSIFHMPIFFYISGYLAFKQITGIKELGLRLWKKTHALLFPYIAFAGIYCFFFKKDFVHLLSVGGAEYWFMYVLFLLTVFFLLYEQVVKNIKNPYLYVLAWVTPYAMLLFIQHSVWRNVYMGGGCVINQLVAYYRFYLLGYLCKKYKSINNLLFYNKYVYAIGFVAFFRQMVLEPRAQYVHLNDGHYGSNHRIAALLCYMY